MTLGLFIKIVLADSFSRPRPSASRQRKPPGADA
jgi:hypothetical protein